MYRLLQYLAILKDTVKRGMEKGLFFKMTKPLNFGLRNTRQVDAMYAPRHDGGKDQYMWVKHACSYVSVFLFQGFQASEFVSLDYTYRNM
jgi:hypothetical protein